MLFTLDEIMTPKEASKRWGIKQDALRMKLKRIKDSNVYEMLINEGKLKYYKHENNERGEWIITVEAMNVLFPKNNKI
ncbi:helix-turn-helix domain-containing protein [Bacillus sp. FSL R9-9410]|uniref:helix-turn-helix domain-containing protein n=1 Tax=Bacillus sp. FSL R9-9410 TaxID=2921590 RepID=UPI003100CC48